MNPPFNYDAGDPALKLPRRPPAPVTNPDAQWRLSMDIEALREREANLRSYEARLRAWQNQLDTIGRVPVAPATAHPFAGSANPFPAADDNELHAAWEKFHRARSLLQAEQNQLRDERLAFRDAQAALLQRESRLAAREAAVAERERACDSPGNLKTPRDSLMRTALRSPWTAAKSVFGGSQ